MTDSLQLTEDFDLPCRQLALETLKEFDNSCAPLLFMNIHTNCVYRDPVDGRVLPDLTERMGFHPVSPSLSPL